ncbi:MAG: FAD-dependent thymidylate synthase [Dehalococcoidales bacterium]
MSDRFQKPKIYLLGYPSIDEVEMARYLTDIGAGGWDTDAPSAAEKLCEFYGRLCYRSFEAGLNKNVTKIREGNGPYLANINRSGHGAVVEHATLNFVFRPVSRVFTHELVRHRVGVAISQESMRYVRLENMQQYASPLIESLPDYQRDQVEGIVEETITVIEDNVKKLETLFGIDDMKNFSEKKKVTSWMRRIAPDGMLTSIGWSANFRTLRHVIPLRTSVHAEEEIREVFDIVAKICRARFPNAFNDLSCNGQGEWTLEKS